MWNVKRSLRNENLLQSTCLVHFFMLSSRFFPLLKAYMYVEFPTMNFNFTLHFLESYFQFNRQYLFEVILHFLLLLSFLFFSPSKTWRVFFVFWFVYSAESFFMYSPWILSNCLHLYERREEEKKWNIQTLCRGTS